MTGPTLIARCVLDTRSVVTLATAIGSVAGRTLTVDATQGAEIPMEQFRDRLRTTETPDRRKVATWRLVGRDCQMITLQDRADAFTAYRWPTGIELPSAARGLVILDGPPNLWEVRDAFPFHRDLWDAVRAGYWAALREMAETSTAGE